MGLFQNLFVSCRLRGSFFGGRYDSGRFGAEIHMEQKKMEKRCWAHSAQPFLAVGFGSR